MSDTPISETRLMVLVEAWGPDIRRWPQAEQTQQARAALAAPSPQLAACLHAADRLQSALDTLVMTAPPLGLAERVLASAPGKQPQGHKPDWRQTVRGWLAPQGVAWPAGAALASLAIGLLIGLQISPSPTATSAEDEAVYSALGLQDYTALAQGEFE